MVESAGSEIDRIRANRGYFGLASSSTLTDIYIYIYICVCVYLDMYIYIYICIYAYVYIYIYGGSSLSYDFPDTATNEY